MQSSVKVPSHLASSQPDSAHASYRWKCDEGPNPAWHRRLWGSELLFYQYAQVTDHTADVIEYVHVSTASPAFAGAAFIEHARNAWLHCRFDAPLVAGRIQGPAHQAEFRYEPIKDAKKLSEWLDGSMVFHDCKSSDDFAAKVETIRYALSSQAVPDEWPTRLHIVASEQPDTSGKRRFCALLNAPHYLADGSAALIVLHLFLAALAKGGDAFKLPWGDEVANLPPSAADAVGIRDSEWDQQEAARLLAPVLSGAGPGLCLMPQVDAPDPVGWPVGATKRQLVKLDPSTSAQLSASLKKRGPFTVSHAIDAARHVAVWWLSRQNGEQQEDRKHITNLLLPIDCTRHFDVEWKGRPYYCPGTAAFTTSTPLDAFVPSSDVEENPQALKAAFDAVLPALAAQWKTADARKGLTGVPGIIELLKIDVENPVHLKPQTPSDAFTSLGILERLLHHDYPDGASSQSDRALRVEDFVLCPRMTTPQVCLHTWSFRSEVHLSVSYTAHYSDNFVREFLAIMEQLLVTAASE